MKKKELRFYLALVMITFIVSFSQYGTIEGYAQEAKVEASDEQQVTLEEALKTLEN